MSTAATRAPERIISSPTGGLPPVGRRVSTRRRLAVPLSVTVLRSGVPDTVPGRSVDVCEGGIGAVLAGEVFAGELVGVEFQIPKFGPVLAKARVCYQERLRCGLRFLAIPPEQKLMIESWTHDRPELPTTSPPRVKVNPVPSIEAPIAPPEPAFAGYRAEAQQRQEASAASARYIRRKVLMLLIASVIVVAGMGWWHWEEGWRELESKLPGHVTLSQPRTTVPGDVMMRLLVHRVEPTAPNAKMRGRIVLNAVVGADGTVQSLQPESGPDLLARAAMDAVQWWRFQPYELNGQPIQVATTLEVNF
jgi:Gram-negative bacterial TonB protein C-terminal/PilZ domain